MVELGNSCLIIGLVTAFELFLRQKTLKQVTNASLNSLTYSSYYFIMIFLLLLRIIIISSGIAAYFPG